MDDKDKEGETEWELHKSVFCNDLRRLTQILKVIKNKEIDKKGKIINFKKVGSLECLNNIKQ